MASKAVELYREALLLSEEEREELLWLLTARDEPLFATSEIEKAWMDECDRRLKDIDDGKSTWVDGDEAMGRVREHLRKRRSE